MHSNNEEFYLMEEKINFSCKLTRRNFVKWKKIIMLISNYKKITSEIHFEK